MGETDYRLLQIIEDIKNMADSIDGSDEDLRGCLVAYAETLHIIQEKLTEEERKTYRLDFDIDEKYM